MATYTEYQQRLLDQTFERELERRAQAHDIMKNWVKNWRKQQQPQKEMVQLEFEFMKETTNQGVS